MVTKVLWAEDDPIYHSEYVPYILEKCKEQGLEVAIDTCKNGTELLRTLGSGPNGYRLIFLDNLMDDKENPTLSGLDCLDFMRDLFIKHGKGIPVYMVCSGNKNIRRVALDLGAAGYVDKAIGGLKMRDQLVEIILTFSGLE